jgi:peptidoglycan/xylan/chitin deacetylase (PgdA/CDA1 family)
VLDRLVFAFTRRRLIALTFDDGPDEKTSAILDLLDEHEAAATFFVLGRQVKGREHVLRRTVESGHELGNHSFSHPRFAELQPPEIEDELVRTSNAIEGAVGFRPRLMRPPYGLGAFAASPVATRLGMKTVLWSVNPKDWDQAEPEQIVEGILAGARPGAVVALHDGAARRGDRAPTVVALATVIPRLERQGYRFVTISTLLQLAPWIAPTVIPLPKGRLRRAVYRGRRWLRAEPAESAE